MLRHWSSAGSLAGGSSSGSSSPHGANSNGMNGNSTSRRRWCTCRRWQWMLLSVALIGSSVLLLFSLTMIPPGANTVAAVSGSDTNTVTITSRAISGSSAPTSRSYSSQSTDVSLTRHSQYRVAVVLTWIGDTFPPWFAYFLQSAGSPSNAYLFDFLIFHESATLPAYAANLNERGHNNIQIIDVGVGGLGQLYGRGMATALGHSSSSRYEDSFQKLFAAKPYLITEYKPATGVVFQYWLKHYTHWTYTDPDIVWGDISSWVHQNELRDFDISTWTFGDNWALYLRGQFTIHKNTHYVNNLWQGCAFLAKRLLSELHRKVSTKCSKHSKSCFNSAEGCYSWATHRASNNAGQIIPETKRVFNASNTIYNGLAVQFSTKFLAPHGSITALVVDGRLYYCTSLSDCRKIAALLPTEPSNNALNGKSLKLYDRSNQPLLPGMQRYDSSVVSVPMDPDPKGDNRCARWVSGRYQVCASRGWRKVAPTHQFELINGTWLARRYENVHTRRMERAFFHFQTWKDEYKRLGSSSFGWNDHKLLTRYYMDKRGIHPLPDDFWPPPKSVRADDDDKKWKKPMDERTFKLAMDTKIFGGVQRNHEVDDALAEEVEEVARHQIDSDEVEAAMEDDLQHNSATTTTTTSAAVGDVGSLRRAKKSPLATLATTGKMRLRGSTQQHQHRAAPKRSPPHKVHTSVPTPTVVPISPTNNNNNNDGDNIYEHDSNDEQTTVTETNNNNDNDNNDDNNDLGY